ncbi:MAG: tRNA pseudouridine(55) synthase TruB [Coprobacillus sp.]|nr:tRNA pseudouridine(55) synthase TruB [Coprobacillus sp.]
MNEVNGLVLIYKEKGVTSREVTNQVSKFFGVKKCGHLGTLDPFAEGLLPVFIGKATKMIPYVDDESKTYTATMRLGERTESLDTDSKVIETSDIPPLSEDKIKEVFTSFIGTYKQKIPKESAKRVNGKHLYEYAHKGVDVASQYKDVTIYSLDLISYSDKEITFSATVSKGTYIRALSLDIALALGTISYLTSLIRTRIGAYHIGYAHKISELIGSDVIPLKDIKTEYKPIEISDDLYQKALHGNSFPSNYLIETNDKILLCYKGETVALYKKEGDTYICERGLL